MPCATVFTVQYLKLIFKTVDLALPDNNTSAENLPLRLASLLLDNKTALIFCLQELADCSFSKTLRNVICRVIDADECKLTFARAPNLVMAMIAFFLRQTSSEEEQLRFMRDALNICNALDLQYPTPRQWFTYLDFSQFWMDEINKEVTVTDMLLNPDLFDSNKEYNSLIETLRGLE